MVDFRSAVAPALVVAAGASLAVQQVLNAGLRLRLGSPWWAAFASYAAGAAAMLVIAVSLAGGLPSRVSLARTPWPLWTGGWFGAVFITVGALTVPRLGAARVLALAVVGQMAASLACDQFGWFGMPRHPLDGARLLGGLLLVAGVTLVRS